MHNLNNKKKKKYNSKVTATTTLSLLLLIVTSITLPLMLFPAPLAAADKKACTESGGTWVQGDKDGFCFRKLEPEVCKLAPIPEAPDPELCVKGSIIVPGTTSTTCAPTVVGGANTTTAEGEVGGGNQSASEFEMLIEEACMALQNNDTQGALMQLSSALGEFSSNVTTTTAGSGNATNATAAVNQTAAEEPSGVGQTQAPIVLQVQGTPGETIEGVQQRLVEEINSDPRLTPEQKTQAISQLNAEVAAQPPEIERADCHWVIIIHLYPPPISIELKRVCGDQAADITPSDETGGGEEAAPQTTTEQGDLIPGLEVEEGGGEGGEAEGTPQTTTQTG